MRVEGGCYCGEVRYRAEGEPLIRLQCHCRECQYLSGGGPNFTMAFPAAGFAYTRGQARAYRRSDLERPVTREFCPGCGSHILSRSPRFPDAVLLKVGTLDDPSVYGRPEVATFTIDRQAWHHLPDDLPAFERSRQPPPAS